MRNRLIVVSTVLLLLGLLIWLQPDDAPMPHPDGVPVPASTVLPPSATDRPDGLDRTPNRGAAAVGSNRRRPVGAGPEAAAAEEAATPLPEVPMPEEWGHLPNLGRLSMPPGALRRVFIGDETQIEPSDHGLDIQKTEDGVLVLFGVQEGTVWLRVGEAGVVEVRVDPTAPLQIEAPDGDPSEELLVGDPADNGASIPLVVAVDEEIVISLLGIDSVAVSAPEVVNLREGEPGTLVIRGLSPGLAIVQLGEDRYEVWVHED